jgi:hypothetical protein
MYVLYVAQNTATFALYNIILGYYNRVGVSTARYELVFKSNNVASIKD